jgi:hypothetical protein
MKVSITTDDGEVVEVLTKKDMGNLDKALARSHLMGEIFEAIKRAGQMESGLCQGCYKSPCICLPNDCDCNP